jgi:drug/metabolite transporter (DMT)-like permease
MEAAALVAMGPSHGGDAMTATPTASPAAPDRLTLAAFLGVVVFGGVNAIAVKLSVEELAPFWSAGLRFIAAGMLLVGIVMLTRRSFPRGRSLSGAVLYGTLAFAASYAFIYPALREVPAGTAMVLISLVPLLTFGFAILHGQERFHVQGLLGALIALGGVALVVADQLDAAVPLGSLLLILVGVAFIAESGVILKWVPRSDPFATNAVAMLVGAVILVAISIVSGEVWSLPTQPGTWASLTYLVVFGSIALFGLYLFALRRWTASAVSYVTLLMPLVTVPLAAALIAEQVSLWFLVGGAIALAGVYVGAFLKIRPRRSSATSAPECLPIDACAESEADTKLATRTAS